MTALPKLPGCGRPAFARFELYTPPGHQDLVGAVWLCGDHDSAYELREATGLIPYRTSSVPAVASRSRCGEAFDFNTMRMVPAPDAPADDVEPTGPPPAYRVVVRHTDRDSFIDVVRDGAVLLTWTFAEACEVAQQMADQFGTFDGPLPAACRRGGP
jgi:hypothetical protein